ncbi:MAG: sulfotransferase family protein [Solirubrobacterales bacterium]
MGLLRRSRANTEAERTPAPFIVGVARSGTTLLRMMLDANSQLAIPPETHFIPKLIKASEETDGDERDTAFELLTTHRRWPDFQLDPDALRDDFDRIEPFEIGPALRAFYGAYAQGQGKTRWGDKTPGYARRMRRIITALPEAHFVHLIRDGRDVALSQLEVHHGAESVREAAEAWTGGIEKARRNARRVDHYTEVRYEDLVDDPEPVVRRVCEFVDLAYEPEMLSYHERADERMSELERDFERAGTTAIPADVRAQQHRRVSSPPQKQRSGRWRTDMSDEDRASFEDIAGPLLAELGYDVGAEAGS